MAVPFSVASRATAATRHVTFTLLDCNTTNGSAIIPRILAMTRAIELR